MFSTDPTNLLRKDNLDEEEMTYSRKEDSLLLSEHPLSLITRSVKQKASDWTVPGNIASDVVKAFEAISFSGYSREVHVLVPPGIYSTLHRVVDRTGTLEIELIRSLANVIVSEQLKDSILMVAKAGFTILESSPVKVDNLGRIQTKCS